MHAVNVILAVVFCYLPLCMKFSAFIQFKHQRI